MELATVAYGRGFEIYAQKRVTTVLAFRNVHTFRIAPCRLIDLFSTPVRSRICGETKLLFIMFQTEILRHCYDFCWSLISS